MLLAKFTKSKCTQKISVLRYHVTEWYA